MDCSVPDSLSLADKITINKLSVITFTNVLPCNTHKDTFTIKIPESANSGNAINIGFYIIKY